MKTPTTHRRPQGFTLIELLVVIAIIATLSAIAMTAIPAARNNAKRTTSLAVATGIEQAVNQYYHEYSALPSSGGSGDADETVRTDGQQGSDLLAVLMGKEDTQGKMQNKKQLPFLSLKEALGKKGGVVYGSGNTKPQALYDDFGNPYFIVLNQDYNETLTLKDSVGGKNQKTELRDRKVVVYTAGADLKLGTTDDVKTW